MDFETLKWYWGIFVQVWWLFKKYRNVHSDDEWEILVQEATDLRQKYPGKFSQKIIMDVLDELDRRAGVGTNKNKDRPWETDTGFGR